MPFCSNQILRHSNCWQCKMKLLTCDLLQMKIVFIDCEKKSSQIHNNWKKIKIWKLFVHIAENKIKKTLETVKCHFLIIKYLVLNTYQILIMYSVLIFFSKKIRVQNSAFFSSIRRIKKLKIFLYQFR